jgi:hypothetical protein
MNTPAKLNMQNLYTFVMEYTPKITEVRLYHTLCDAKRQIEHHGGLTSDMVRSIKMYIGVQYFA